MRTFFFVLAIGVTIAVSAASLPGFGVQRLGSTSGFLTSLAIDSKGTLYYTSKSGSIFRFENGSSTRVAQVSTVGICDSGLLGMALIDDRTAAVHYTIPKDDPEFVLYDVISRIDLETGVETELHRFACDVEIPERGGSAEHHGGNLVVAPDGSIFAGIGEYNGYKLAWFPEWNGGKIWRVYPDGSAVQYVLGLRNTFDLVWDDAKQRLIFADNGPIGGDEINIVTTPGANCGWPFVSGFDAYPEGTLAPVFVWEETIAPTGTLALTKANEQLRSGIMIAGYVSKQLHYVPDVDVMPLPQPLVLLDMSAENAELIDVAESPDGTIYVASGFAIFQLITPQRGDCNGDGIVNAADVAALSRELADAPEARIDAQHGLFRGSWGCDANGDDLIDSADSAALVQLLTPRRRAVRAGR